MAIRSLKSNLALVKIITLLVVPAAFFFIPEQQIFHGAPLCLSVRLFNHTCWGCGMTRALWLSIHGDFMTAFTYNWRIVVVVPIFIGAWIKIMFRMITELRNSFHNE